MDIQELDQELALSNGTLTLTTATLDGLLADFLNEDNAGQPLIISNASKTTTETEVAVAGTMSYLNVVDAPSRSVFTLQPDGSVAAVITITLPDDWTFSTSFPSLPSLMEQSTDPSPVLGTLSFATPAFVIATAAGTDSTGAPLVPGLNFVGRFDPRTVSGLFSILLGDSYPVYGTIAIPQPTTITALGITQLPWEATWDVPGIDLRAPLGVDIRIGSLVVDDAFWRIYSPTDTTWLASNPTYQPLLAVTTAMAVPSANISASVTAAVLLDTSGSMSLSCDFRGVTIGRLGDLVDLVAGPPDLDSILPREIQDALAGVTVESASLSMSGSWSADAVAEVALKVGLPGTKWEILPGLFTIENVGCHFLVLSPFTGSRSMTVTLSGTIAVAGLSATVVTQYPSFETYASATATLPLTTLFETLVPSLPPPPALELHELSLQIVPEQQYRFTASMADEPEWSLALGPFGMTIGSAAVDVWDDGAGMQGTFTGTLLFSDEIETEITYDTPGSFTIHSEFPPITLSEIVARLDEIGVTVPTGFEIEFTESYILIEEQSSGLTFSVGATVSNLGLVAFTAQEQSGAGWGYAVGIDLDAGGIAALPGLAPIAEFESFVGLDALLMLVSSLADPGFTFPDMTAFDADPIQGRSMPLPSQATGVVRGVNVYAQLDAAKNEGLRILADYLGIALDGSVGVTLAVTAPDPTTGSKLFVTVDTDLNGKTSIAGQLGVLVISNEFAVFLDATVLTSIQGEGAQFDVTAEVLPTGVLISGSMIGTIRFPPVTLSNIAIVIGLNDAAVPSFGFAATIDVEDFESSIAIFFDSVDPARSMFAGSVSDLTLLSVATLIAGQSNVPSSVAGALAQFGLRSLDAFTMPASVAPSLDARDIDAIRTAFGQANVPLPSSFDQIFFVVNTKGKVWHLTDLSRMLHYELRANGSVIDVSEQPQIYCAPQTTYLGALEYPAGVHVIAEIDEFLIKARIRVLIESPNGIAADVGADPIVLVSSNFFSITGEGANGGPLLSMATYDQPSQSDPLLRPPHFFLSGVVRVLGSDLADGYVTISESGLQFEFKMQVASAVSVDLRGSVPETLLLTIAGSATVGIDEVYDGDTLGRIHVKTTVHASLDIGTVSGAHATVEGTFSFEGLSLNIPRLSLDISTPALANLAATLWQAMLDVLDEALADSALWLQCVASGIVEDAAKTAEDVGRVLDGVYGLGGDAIVDQTESILRYNTTQVADALQGAGHSAEETVELLEDAGHTAEEAAEAVEDAFAGGSHVDFDFDHGDIPGQHTDSNHTDDNTLHSDDKHTDDNTLHSDTGHADDNHLHVDTGHSDSIFYSDKHTDTGHIDDKHSDSGHIDWGHTDTGHIDGGHTDVQEVPHEDTTLHVDT